MLVSLENNAIGKLFANRSNSCHWKVVICHFVVYFLSSLQANDMIINVNNFLYIIIFIYLAHIGSVFGVLFSSL